MKTLIVFYSYSGNTQKIAQRIHQQLGGDLLQLETVVPYTGGYNAVVQQGQREVNQGYLPELKPLELDPADYDVIYLGTPVWWYTFAPAVRTFLTEHPLAGKTIRPFITDGGGIGHTVQDLARACPDAVLAQAIDIRFDGAAPATPIHEIDRWIHAAE